MTQNVYGFYSPLDISKRLLDDIAHFAQKHGCIPDTVLMPPNLLPVIIDGNEVLAIYRDDEQGYPHEIKIVEDATQLSASYTICKEDENERE